MVGLCQGVRGFEIIEGWGEGWAGMITVQDSSRLSILSPVESLWEVDMVGLGLGIITKYATRET